MTEALTNTATTDTAPPITETTPETPSKTPDESTAQDVEMSGIETTDSFTYVTTLQFYDAHAVSGSASSSTLVGKKVKEWLSAMLMRNDQLIIKTKEGVHLKLTEYPDNEADAYESLKYEVFRHNRRNISVLLYITSNLRFHDIKQSVLTYLHTKNMYMSRHLFKTQKTNIAKCGFFVGKHPRDTFRDVFKTHIETEMAKILQEMTDTDRAEYVLEFVKTFDDTPSAENEVQLLECSPTWRIEDKAYATEALSVHCPRENMYMVMDLISRLFPGTPKDEFDDDPVIKFVPFSTPYDHSIPHSESAYASLIQEQNQFLQEHVGIPIGGLSYEAMAYCPDNGMALDSTLYYTKLFTALEPTSIVHKTGKWIFCTTKKKATQALKYIATELSSLYTQVPTNYRGDYPMCPNPRRLTRSPIRTAYMVNIVNGANQMLIQNAKSNFQQAPKTNAWRAAPPPSLLANSDTASTPSSSGSLGSTHIITAIDEHREEVKVTVTQMQSAIQMYQVKTDSQFLSLTQQLENQIKKIQLNTDTTKAAIQNSPALSPENFTHLKDEIIKELTPVITDAINAAVPSVIRSHIDSCLGPAIYAALSQLNLIPQDSLLPPPLLTEKRVRAPAGSPPSGFTPTRKMNRTDADPMDSTETIPLPATQPPDPTQSPLPNCS